MRVTFTFGIVSVLTELLLGMGIALAINRAFVGRGAVRAAVLVPWALTTVVSAKIWAWIYDPQWRVVNDLLLRLREASAPGKPKTLRAHHKWRWTLTSASATLASPPFCSRRPNR